jgi:hypothetical protein
MKRAAWGVLLVLLSAPRAWGATATDVGTSFTSSGAVGDATADRVIARDNGAEGRANYVRIRANDTDITGDTTCANQCTTNRACLIDIDESASDTWVLCVGTSDFFHFPNTGSDTIASGEILVGTGSNAAAYVAMSGDVAIDSAGATTIQPNSVALSTDTTGNYVASFSCGSGLSGCPSAGEGATGTITAADTSATNEIQNLFETFDTPSGTDPVADSPTDTLAITGTAPVTVTGNATTDTVTIAVTQNGGTDITADLEEETHASEHSLGGGDAITVTNLASGCTDAQVLGGNSGGTGVECQTDDDVPEAADYSNLTAGTGITNSPTGTINATLGTAIDTSEITDGTIAYADVNATQTLAGNPANGDSSVWFGTTGLIFEGATSNSSEGLLAAADVSGDRTWTLPDETGTVCTTGSVCTGYQAGPLSGDVVTSGAAATIQPNSVALGTDTTNNYVTSVSVSAPIACTGCTAAEGGTPAISVDNATTGSAGVIQLAGDLAGTGTSPSVVDDSHAHTGATLSGIDISDDTNLAAGAGVALTGDTLSTASQEVAFLADGGSTSLTCGGSNQGKMQVLDSGALEWCDGAPTSVLRSTADLAAASHSHTAVGDVGGDLSSLDLDEAAVEAELESVLDLDQLQGQIADGQIADGAVDGGTGGEIADASITAADLGTDSVSADELNAPGVEAELEAVLDLQDLQGAVTDAQVPNSITVDAAGAAPWSGLTGALGNSQQVPWSDVGAARAATGVLSITNGSSGRGDLEVLDLDTQVVSVSDNGTGTAATFNLDPQKSYVEITCSDSNGCDGTLQETSAREGRGVDIRNVGTNQVNFSNVTNVLTLNASPWPLSAKRNLVLNYDGAEWSQAGDQLRIREGSAEKGLNGGITFASGDFDVTSTSGDASVALEATVTRVGNTIEPSETTGPFAYTDVANDFTNTSGQQIKGSLRLRDSSNVEFLNCGQAAAGTCRYTGAYSNNDDIPTKSDVDAGDTATAAALPKAFATFNAMAANTATGIGAGKEWVYTVSLGTSAANWNQPMGASCTVSATTTSIVRFGSWPSGATITISLRKNNSATGEIVTTFTDQGDQTGSGTLAFGATDKWHWRAACSGTCTDASTTLYLRGTARCL